MVNDAQEIILEHLRAIRSDTGEMKHTLEQHDKRLNNIERQVAGIRGDMAVLQELYVDHREDFTRLEKRVTRIERRLDLEQAAPPEG